MSCPKSVFRAAYIKISTRPGYLLTYELDFCIHWREGLPGSQQPVNLALQNLRTDVGLQGLWCVLLQLFPVPASR